MKRFLQLAAALRPHDAFRRPEALERCARLFRGLDVNASGLLSVHELQMAFAEVAPRLPTAAVRRRIHLAFGSLANLMKELRRVGEDSESEVELDVGAAGREQAPRASRKALEEMRKGMRIM